MTLQQCELLNGNIKNEAFQQDFHSLFFHDIDLPFCFNFLRFGCGCISKSAPQGRVPQKEKWKINTTQLYKCLYGNRQRRYFITKNSKRLSPMQGISWRELQAAIFATTRSRQYRSCMEMTYIKAFLGLVEITVNCYFSSTVNKLCTVNVIFWSFLLILLVLHIACSTMHILVKLRDSF